MLQPPGSSAYSRQMRTNRRKTPENPEEMLRSLSRQPSNKKCCECSTKLPQCVNLTVGSFVCMACSGVLRELNHRVKGMGASTFSQEEAEKMKLSSNEKVNAMYLARYDPSRDRLRQPQDNFDLQLLRVWIRRKYHDKAWYSPSGEAQQQQPTRAQIPPKKEAPAPAVDLLGFDATAPAPAPPPAPAAAAPANNGGWDNFGGSTANANQGFNPGFPAQQPAVQQQQPAQQQAFANFTQQQPQQQQQPQTSPVPQQQQAFANFNQPAQPPQAPLQQPTPQQQPQGGGFGNFKQQQQPPPQQQQPTPQQQPQASGFGNFNQQKPPPQQQQGFGNFGGPQQPPQPQQQGFANFGGQPQTVAAPQQPVPPQQQSHQQQGFANFGQQQTQQPQQQQQQVIANFGGQQQPQQQPQQNGHSPFRQQQNPFPQQPQPSDPYSMSPQEQSQYASVFSQNKQPDGFIYGAQAVPLFTSLNMAQDKLRDIWTLSDFPVDNRLDEKEFVIAMHLIHAVGKKGLALPSALPISLQQYKNGAGAAGPQPAAPGAMQQQQKSPPVSGAPQQQPIAAQQPPTMQPVQQQPPPPAVQPANQQANTGSTMQPGLQQQQQLSIGGPPPLQQQTQPSMGGPSPLQKSPTPPTLGGRAAQGGPPPIQHQQQQQSPSPQDLQQPGATTLQALQQPEEPRSDSVISQAGSDANSRKNAFDAFSEISMASGEVSEKAPSEKAPTSTSKYSKSQSVIYTDSQKNVFRAKILKVHYDDDLEPFYTILLPSGKEKQTDDAHLEEEDQDTLKEVNRLIGTLHPDQLQQVHDYIVKLKTNDTRDPMPSAQAPAVAATPNAQAPTPASMAAPAPAAMPAPTPASMAPPAPSPMPAPTPASMAAPASTPVPAPTPAPPLSTSMQATVPMPGQAPGAAPSMEYPSTMATAAPAQSIQAPAPAPTVAPSMRSAAPAPATGMQGTMTPAHPSAMNGGGGAAIPSPMQTPGTQQQVSNMPSSFPAPPLTQTPQQPVTPGSDNPFDASPLSPKGNPFDVY